MVLSVFFWALDGSRAWQRWLKMTFTALANPGVFSQMPPACRVMFWTDVLGGPCPPLSSLRDEHSSEHAEVQYSPLCGAILLHSVVRKGLARSPFSAQLELSQAWICP